MSDTTVHLALPLMLDSQAQKHVSHNEALQILDILVQGAVLDTNRTAPPADPAEGQCHVVAAGATGAWAGQEARVAVFLNGGWVFLAPRAGWRLALPAASDAIVFDGTLWQAGAETRLRAAELGVNAASDATNRLAVASEATLFTHAGAGHQVKVNKAAAGDTASLLFQTGWSGRAEMGTTGSDDFAIRTSANGGSFVTALRAAAGSGRVALPAGLDGAAGTAAAPGIAFDGDSDTGFYRIAANQLGLSEGGVDRGRPYARKNVLGTVSQSGGVPTGALIEQGTNASGRYVRFADGTQICTGLVTLAYSGVAGILTVIWTYPATFAAAPVTSFVSRTSGGDYTNVNIRDMGARVVFPGTLTAVLNQYSAPGATGTWDSTSQITNVAVTATGRWY